MTSVTRRILVGSLAAGIPRQHTTIVLDLGLDHPSRAGLLQLDVTVDGDTVSEAVVRPGAMHRGAEKLFEVREYRQILMLADRHDWQAPFHGELAAVLVFEDLLGLQAPPRATWLRTLLAEHTRLLSHLGFLGWAVRHDAARATRWRTFRERLREQTAQLTGNRIHPMANRIGGVAADPTPAWLEDEARLALDIGQDIEGLDPGSLPGVGVAPVTTELIDQFGLSGPLARASGVPLDLRVTTPDLAYAELGDLLQPSALEALTPSDASGDAAARFQQLRHEIRQSAVLVPACCERLPEGPVTVRLPKIVKLPDAEAYHAVEAPLGRAGFHVVSRGDKTPWRMKMRTPSFQHVAALEALLPGCRLDDVETVLASVGHVIGDVDK